MTCRYVKVDMPAQLSFVNDTIQRTPRSYWRRREGSGGMEDLFDNTPRTSTVNRVPEAGLNSAFHRRSTRNNKWARAGEHHAERGACAFSLWQRLYFLPLDTSILTFELPTS